MLNYADTTTPELIDLLFREEDRVTLAHIQEVIRRGDEALSRLRELLANEDYWYEGQHGEFWIELHTVVALGALHDQRVLPELLETVMTSYFSGQDWVTERWNDVLAQFGAAAVEPLIEFVQSHRKSYLDNQDYAFARNKATEALTRIAREHPQQKARVLDFICATFTDPKEEDAHYLSASLLCPVALDRARGLPVVRAVYERRLVHDRYFGKYKDFVKYINDPRGNPFRDFRQDLFDFYQPKAIAARQQNWERLKAGHLKPEPDEANFNRATDGPPPFPLPMAHMYQPITPPDGAKPAPAAHTEKVGRNDPCPCGSGKKFKKCCGK